ncbi:MAG: hypothetical protein GY772_13605 [bacterium]|nr:hypothetical protein [bacterium]
MSGDGETRSVSGVEPVDDTEGLVVPRKCSAQWRTEKVRRECGRSEPYAIPARTEVHGQWVRGRCE